MNIQESGRNLHSKKKDKDGSKRERKQRMSSNQDGAQSAVFELSTHFLSGNPMTSGNPMGGPSSEKKAKPAKQSRQSAKFPK